MLPTGHRGFLPAFCLADDEGSYNVIFHHIESGLGCCLESGFSAPLVQAAICGLPGLTPSFWEVCEFVNVCYPVRVTEGVHSQL